MLASFLRQVGLRLALFHWFQIEDIQFKSWNQRQANQPSQKYDNSWISGLVNLLHEFNQFQQNSKRLWWRNWVLIDWMQQINRKLMFEWSFMNENEWNWMKTAALPCCLLLLIQTAHPNQTDAEVWFPTSSNLISFFLCEVWLSAD